jgi:hypothetical protein
MVMSSRGSSSNWAVFGKAAWDVVVDLASDGKTRVELAVWPSFRSGVFIWEAKAMEMQPDSAEWCVSRVQAEFPNARAETLEAFLYSLVTKLAHCVQARNASDASQKVKAGR